MSHLGDDTHKLLGDVVFCVKWRKKFICLYINVERIFFQKGNTTSFVVQTKKEYVTNHSCV